MRKLSNFQRLFHYFRPSLDTDVITRNFRCWLSVNERFYLAETNFALQVSINAAFVLVALLRGRVNIRGVVRRIIFAKSQNASYFKSHMYHIVLVSLP